MKRLLILGAVLAALGLAACGGDSGGSSSADASAGNATVSAEQISGAGTVLVDSAGQALYASDEEAGGMARCTDDACMSFWHPLTVDGNAPTGGSLPGKLAVVKRPDGDRQVTYNGKLLYTFSQDQPGEVTGDGFADAFGGQQFTWHVVHANGAQDSSGSDNTSSGIYG